jgi:hypothetical protein
MPPEVFRAVAGSGSLAVALGQAREIRTGKLSVPGEAETGQPADTSQRNSQRCGETSNRVFPLC